MRAPSLRQIEDAAAYAFIDKATAQRRLRSLWDSTKESMQASNFHFGIKLFKRREAENGRSFIFCGMHVEGRNINTVWIVSNPPKGYDYSQRVITVPFYTHDMLAVYSLRNFHAARRRGTKPGPAPTLPKYARLYKFSEVKALCFS